MDDPVRTMSAFRRAWDDTESFRASLRFFVVVEVSGALVFGGAAFVYFTDANSSRTEQVVWPGLGTIVGLAMAYLAILGFNLLRAPYRQRFDAEQSALQLSRQMEALNNAREAERAARPKIMMRPDVRRSVLRNGAASAYLTIECDGDQAVSRCYGRVFEVRQADYGAPGTEATGYAGADLSLKWESPDEPANPQFKTFHRSAVLNVAHTGPTPNDWHFDVVKEPAQFAGLMKDYTYSFEIQIAAENIDPITETFTLHFTDHVLLKQTADADTIMFIPPKMTFQRLVNRIPGPEGNDE